MMVGPRKRDYGVGISPMQSQSTSLLKYRSNQRGEITPIVYDRLANAYLNKACEGLMAIVPFTDYDEGPGGTGSEWFLSRLGEAECKLIGFIFDFTKSRAVIIML